MEKMRFILILIAISLLTLVLAGPVSAAVHEDEEAGYKIEYDDENWLAEDMGMMFGDITEFDEKIVSEPFVIVNYDEGIATIFIVVSERDDYENDMLAFVEESMGELDIKSEVYEEEDVFTDAAGNEFDSLVRVWGVAPEFEDEGLLLSQMFFSDDRRYEICFLALPDNFVDAWKAATAIMDSIEIG